MHYIITERGVFGGSRKCGAQLNAARTQKQRTHNAQRRLPFSRSKALRIRERTHNTHQYVMFGWKLFCLVDARVRASMCIASRCAFDGKNQPAHARTRNNACLHLNNLACVSVCARNACVLECNRSDHHI